MVTKHDGDRAPARHADEDTANAEAKSARPAPLPVAPLSAAERIACLRLARAETVGPATFRQLINRCGGAVAAIEALPHLARRGGRARAPRIPTTSDAEAELDAARRCGARALFTIEPGYPARLASLDLPPPMIYVRGDPALMSRPSVALVGSREASAAGCAFTRTIAGALAARGYVIVSGLARGIDAAAHTASLAWGTVAVVAGGTDVIYPPEHAELHEAIATQGCVVSEMPAGFRPRGKDFPRRNRIISGVSLGVVIVEAAARSGSLITARMALEQGREVFAVPGHPLDPRAYGTNRLIKQGATLVTEIDDVIEVLEPMIHSRASLPPQLPVSPRRDPRPIDVSDAVRGRVVAALGPAPVSADDLARATGLDIRDVQVALLELSLAGRLEHAGGQLVALRPRSDFECDN